MSQASTTQPRFNWPNFVWLLVIHLLAVGGLVPCFTWTGLIIVLILYIVTGLGVTVGLHRLFTHASFKTTPAWRAILGICATLAGQGPLSSWILEHRKHHEEVEKESDPHSPVQEGFWWSHILWILWRMPDQLKLSEQQHRYIPDIVGDKLLMDLSRNFLCINLLFAAALFCAGALWTSVITGFCYVVYGVCLRMVLVMHATWFVNSAAHLWGYRNYQTRDNSRNTWWVALITFGEGWHNNHHAKPSLAQMGHRRFEIDLSWRFITMLEKFGWATDVKRARSF